MIIISMGAGLGNQMFEYAFYLRLKHLYPDRLIKVDTKYAFPYAHNGIELFDLFSLHPMVATKEEVLKLASRHVLNGDEFQEKGIVSKVIRYFRLFSNTMLVQRDYSEYYPKFLQLEENKSFYLFGPFANYRYFREIEDVVKETYLFPEITDKKNLDYRAQIENSNSVSIHIRKGDYVKEGVKLASKEFYEEAMDYLENTEDNLCYFIFTDDKEYARELFLDKSNCIIIDGNEGINSFRDMQLMSICKHNITANSTFSFWGAYLNNNPDKIVIAPNLPFTGMKNPFVCDDWVLL